jgi:N12 class adenine-specific DNA methylase
MANESFTREDIKQAWESPRFNSLPEDDRIAIMSDMDPEFARFPAIDRRRVVQRFAQQLKAGRPNSMARPASEDMAAAVSLTNPQLDAPTFGGIAQPPMPPPPPAASRNPMRRSSDLASVPQDPYAATPAAGPSPFTVNSLPQDSTPAAAGTQQQQNPLEIEAARMGIIPHSDRTMLPAAKPTGVIRNIARPGPHVTLLPQNEELEFRKWVATNRVPFDPGPQSDYDMRGYWKALRARDQRVAGSDPLNPPAEFQTPYHPEFSNKSIFAGADAPKWMQDKLVDSFGRVIKDKAAEKAAEKMLAQKNVAAVAKRSPRQPFVFSPTGGINGMGDPEMVPQYQPPVETPLAGIIPGTEKMGGGAPGVPLPEMPEFNPSWQELQRQPGADNPKLFFDPMTGTSEPAAGSTPAEIAQFGMDEPTNVGIRSAFTGAGQMALDAPGGLAQMTGYAIGSPMLTGVGKDMADVGRGLSEALAPPPGMRSYDEAGNAVFADPNWWANTFGNGIGSMVPLMLAGMGIGAIIERAVGSGLIRGALAEHVIKYGPAATSGLSEGILAGGSAYNEAKAAGKSEAEAQQVFAIVAASTAATAIPAFKVGAFNDALPMVAKAPASALAEGGQEIVQGAGENYAADRPLMADSVENFVGGAFGGAGGAMMEGGANRPARVSPSMQQEFEGLDREMRGGQPNPPPPGAPPPAPPASNQQTPQAAPPAAPTPNPASTPPQQAEAAPQAPPPPPKKKNPMARPAAPGAPTIEEIPADIEEMLAAEEDGSETPPGQYQTAVEMAKRKGRISPRDLQNELVIGFAEAEELAARLEKDGIVGPIESNGVRWLREDDEEAPAAPAPAPPTSEESSEVPQTADSPEIPEGSPAPEAQPVASNATTDVQPEAKPSAPGPGEEVVQPEPVDAAAPVVEEKKPQAKPNATTAPKFESKVPTKDSEEVAGMKLKVGERDVILGAKFGEDGKGTVGQGRVSKGTEGLISRGLLERDHKTLTAEGARIAKVVQAQEAEDLDGRPMSTYVPVKTKLEDVMKDSFRWDATKPVEIDGKNWISNTQVAVSGVSVPSHWKKPDGPEKPAAPLDKIVNPLKDKLGVAEKIHPVAHFKTKESGEQVVLMSDGNGVRGDYFAYITQNVNPDRWVSFGDKQPIGAVKDDELIAVVMPFGKKNEAPDGALKLLQAYGSEPEAGPVSAPSPSNNPMRPPVSAPAPAQPGPSTEPAPTQPGPSTAPAPEKPGGFDIAGAAGMTDDELIRQVMQNLEGMGIKPPAAATAAAPVAAPTKNPMRKPGSKAGQNTKKHPMSAMWASKPEGDSPVSTPQSAPAPSKNPLDAAAEKARQALDQMLKDAMRGQSNAGIDPTALVHLATIGAKHIIDGAIAFKEWSARFTADAGAFVAHFAKVSSQTTKTILNAIHQKARAIAKAYGIEAEEAPNEQTGDDERNGDDSGALGDPLPGPSTGATGEREPGESSAPGSGESDNSPGGLGAVGDEPGGSDGTGSAGVGSSPEPVKAGNTGSARFERDYRIPDGRKITGTPEKRYEMNVAAIRRMIELEKSGNTPTGEDHEILSQFVGWGAVPQVFAANKPEWVERQKELRSLISEEEYAAASHSTLNAHYTGDEHVDAIWKALQHLGAKAGMSWLEPAVGNGTFFGRQPHSLLAGARRIGIEKETVTGRITRLLYPDSGIEVSGYEEADLPKNFFDGIVSNVPFGSYGVFDPEFKSKGFLTRSIHNYFFAKALDHVKPGGVIAFITSAFTMDAYSEESVKVRKYLASKADLLGAVRLPSDAFKATAGTHVVTDVIFLRRRADGEKENHSSPWMESKYKDLPFEEAGYNQRSSVNEYYHAHPEFVLGKEMIAGGARSRFDYHVIGKASGEDIFAALQKALPEGVLKTKAETNAPAPTRTADVKDAAEAKIGGFVQGENGKMFRRASKGTLEPLTVSANVRDRIVGQMKIRDARSILLDAERSGASDAVLEKLRKALNEEYDRFVKANGILNHRSNISAFFGDPDAPLLRALETKIKGNTAKKAKLFTSRIFTPQEEVKSVSGAKDALSVSLNETGQIDWPRMVKVSGKTEEELQAELAGLVYQDPTTEQWLTAEEYLSGSVRSKLKEAKRVAKIDPKYQANVDALESVIPEDLTPGKISVRAGATWVPPEIYEAFLREALGIRNEDVSVKVGYTESAGWTLKQVSFRAATKSKYESPGRSQEQNINSAFEAKRVRVFDKMSDGSRVFNPDKTAAAQAIVDQFHTDFESWLFGGDSARAEEMVQRYNDRMNDIRLRQFDGSHLTLPGTAAGFELFPHQKNAIWRIMSNRNTLLAHAVGAGKTFEMIAGAMELKRLGLVQRPMFVVPNATLGGFGEQFSALYPNAKVIVFGENDLKKDKRRATIARIASEEWDAVVIPHSSFQFIRVSDKMFDQSIAEREAELKQKVEDARDGGVPTQQIKRMEKQHEEELVALKKKRNEGRQDRAVDWEELGIDMLTVDEAHEYKKLGFSTKMGNVMGIDTQGNQKTFDLIMKVRHVQKYGRGVVFATGTPVTNTMGELFTLMRYLIPDEMGSRQMAQFDEWAAAFGRTVSSFEPKPEGGGYHIKERFARFVNIADLSVLFRTFADVITSDMLDIPRPEVVRETVVTEMSESQKQQMADMQVRAKAIRDDPKGAMPDNMLAIYTDATKLALDQRFLDPYAQEDPEGRVAVAADKIKQIWKDTKADLSTQLVFADLGTPAAKGKKKKGEDGAYSFNVYDAMAQALVDRGIPREEIAYIHDAETTPQRNALMDRMRDGEIRVLIGSSIKAGVGVNVQERLWAIHHLDMPHLPAYMEQRDGRGHRQGNRNPKIHIFHYLTKGTLDELKSSNLARKTKFIEAFLRGDPSIREMEDVADASLTYEQFQAQASNDPRVPRMMDLVNEITRLGVVRAAWTDKRLADARKARLIPAEIKGLEGRVKDLKEIERKLEENKGSFSIGGEEMKAGGSAESWEKLAAAIGAEAEKESAELQQGDTDGRVQIGEGFGFPMFFAAERKTTVKGDERKVIGTNYFLRLYDKATNQNIFDTAAYIDDDGKVKVSPTALPRMLNLADRYEHFVEVAEADLQKAKDTLADLQSGSDGEWPLAKKHEEAAAELKKIQTELGMFQNDKSAGATGGDEVIDTSVAAEDSEGPSDSEESEDDDSGVGTSIRRPVTRGGDQAGFMAPDFLPTIFGGLAGRIRGNPTQKQTQDYHQFPEANEKAFQAAGKAQDEPKGIMDTLKEAYGDFKALGRVYRHLSRANFGPVINKMVKLHKAQGIASSRAMISMSKLVHQTGKMTKPEYELLRKSVIVDDLMETVELFAEKGEPLADDHKLAFNFTPATLREEQAKLKTAIADNEAVSAALEYRKSIWAEIKEEYLDAMKAAGEDVTGKLQRKNYYRHQVLLQKRLEALASSGKLAAPNQRSFLKARDRENVGLDYATNFVETEMKVMTQLMIDTQTAQFVAWLDGKHNIIRDLKEKAKWKNVATVMPYFEAMAADANAQRGPQDESEPLTGNDMFRRTLNRQQAIAMDELGKLAVNDLLPDTPDKKWAETIAALADRHLAKKAAEDEESFHGDTEAGDVIGYAAWLLRQPEASRASRAAGSLFKGIQAKKTAIKRIAGDKFVTWEDLIPETHKAYQMDPKKAYYSVFTIPEHLAMKALEDQAETIGLKAEDIRKVFARGADKDPMILPAEIVKQFEEMQATMAARRAQDNVLVKASQAIMGAWKRYRLISPLYAIKYILRNQSGDLDSMISGLPWGLTLKMIPKVLWPAMKEVKNYFYPILMGRIHEAKMTPKLEGFAKFGAFEGMLAVQEIGDSIVPNVLQEFSRWEKQEPEPGLLRQYGPQSIYGKSVRVAEVINNWREAANRYAAYLVFLEDIQKNNGSPSSYSASLREEVDALETNEEKAYRMSNDLMGAYDEVSRAGQWTRKNLIPFWSYQELNFKRYARLVRNGVREGMTKELVGRMAVGAAARAPYMAYRVASTGVKMYALWALWTMLNGLFAGDDDDKLRKDIRLRPHLTFGSTPDGTEVIYFPRIGNISDILEILDLDEMQDSVKAAWEGRKGWDRAAWDILRGGPLEKLFNSLGPHIKYPIEAIFDKTFYPNIGRPRAIESWPEKIAQELGLGDAFRGLTGRPNRQRNPMQRAADLVIYRADPKESGYYDTLDMKQSWRREQGLPNDGFSSNKPTTEAIRNVKKALRYRDQAAFNTYLQKYVELGGDEKGFDASIKRMAPLAGLNKEQQARFIESLSAEDKKRLDLALEYYDEVFTGDTADKYFREYAPK